MYLGQVLQAGQNNDNLFGINSWMHVDTNGKTGLKVFGQNINWAPATEKAGNVQTAYSLYTDAPTFGARNYAIYVNSGSTRLNGAVGIGTEPDPGVTLRVSAFTAPSSGTSHLGAKIEGGLQLSGGPNGKPPCTEQYRGTLWYEEGAPGTKDGITACLKDSSNNYAWRNIY
jgi:hypothetical protein